MIKRYVKEFIADNVPEALKGKADRIYKYCESEFITSYEAVRAIVNIIEAEKEEERKNEK